MTGYTEARMPSEQKWYALTGRIIDAKVEADGDIHIELQDVAVPVSRGISKWASDTAVFVMVAESYL